MPRFRIDGEVCYSTCLEVEADTREEAIALAEKTPECAWDSSYREVDIQGVENLETEVYHGYVEE